jgi:hypothetical protein
MKNLDKYVNEIYVIFIHLFDSGILLIIDLNKKKGKILLHLSTFYEYQQFVQHRICFSIQPPDYSDPWPRLARFTSLFLLMLFNYVNIPHIIHSFT